MPIVCEKCGAEQPSRPCPACEESAPLWAKFCPWCGASLASPAADGYDDDAPGAGDGEPSPMAGRRACPDGNCIGILGPDGRCIICGKQGEVQQ